MNEADSAKFSKIYKEYSDELQSIREQCRTARRGGMSDEEVEAQMKGRLERLKKVAELKEKYYDKFKEVLTPRQIAALYDGDGFRRDGRKHHDRGHDGYCGGFDCCDGARGGHRGCCY